MQILLRGLNLFEIGQNLFTKIINLTNNLNSEKPPAYRPVFEQLSNQCSMYMNELVGKLVENEVCSVSFLEICCLRCAGTLLPTADD
ncbi:hypothetical protein T10_3725 [Trichinella papuae]|uniref:Uncharacterized protein n=1 Tax=Trichinella papuae TaxID=268474 RepID=A0A0V1N1J3_9BILA|nr:hypothetical protein T10_3725 [Trichinella papuae]